MGQPFIGEIRMFGGNFAPLDWAFCNGQLLSIAENEALFSLIGTTYGGDGVNSFALPDLQCRVPIHQGNSFALAQKAGEENHTLTAPEMPQHSHTVSAQKIGTTNSVKGNVYGGNGVTAYKAAAGGAMSAAVVGLSGGSIPHDNMMPFLAISFIVALNGIYPSRS